MSEELCYGSFIVKKLKKISFQYLLVLIFFTLRNQSLFITWGRVGEFLGDPAVFFWGGGAERRGIGRLLQSLEGQL